MSYSKGILLSLLFIFTLSCKDDSTTIIPSDEKVITSINGIISDENSMPLNNVLIEIEGKLTTTDEYGVFFLKNIEVNSKNAYLTASKSGYYNGSRTFQPIENTKNTVEIMLLTKTQTGSFNSATGGEISLANGTKVSFDANSIISEDGNAYNGEVKVYMKHLNPSDDNFESQMPGNLIAQSSDGNDRVLESYGMLAVELEGSLNEKLNLGEGQTAEIVMPVDPSQISAAPTSIPLWFFDESKGIWKEEGIATLTGTTYIGEVSHFSFWNCDFPFELVKLTGTILNGSTPLSNIKVKVTRVNANGISSAYGYTDENGVFCGLVPANENLEIEIFDNCNNAVATLNIPELATDTDVGELQVLGAFNIVNVIGNATDCDQNIAANSYVILKTDDSQYVQSTTNGVFNFNFLACLNSTSFEIKVIDLDNANESGWQEFLLTSNTIDLGNVLACDEISTYFIYDITGYGTPESYFCPSTVGIYDEDPGFNYLSIQSECSLPGLISIDINDDSPLTVGEEYTVLTNGLSENNFEFWWENNGDFSVQHYNGNYIVVFSNIGANSGDLIEGTINGTSDVINSNEEVVGEIQVSGSFRIFGM